MRLGGQLIRCVPAPEPARPATPRISDISFDPHRAVVRSAVLAGAVARCGPLLPTRFVGSSGAEPDEPPERVSGVTDVGGYIQVMTAPAAPPLNADERARVGLQVLAAALIPTLLLSLGVAAGQGLTVLGGVALAVAAIQLVLMWRLFTGHWPRRRAVIGELG